MKRLITFFFALLFNLVLFAQVSEAETAVLNDLYKSTQGNHWNQKWDLNDRVSQFPGVTVENGHVTEIRMLFNNLNGTLPASLGLLTELRVLELSFNKIYGEIPESLGNLKKLEVLALNGNHLSGAIPSSIGTLGTLKQLHLSSNELSGDLPGAINNLSNLEVFNVFDNELTGQLPIALTTSRNLKEFIVAENHFEDTTEISTVLLRNSGGHVDFNAQMILNSSGKSIIAIESSDDEN